MKINISKIFNLINRNRIQKDNYYDYLDLRSYDYDPLAAIYASEGKPCLINYRLSECIWYGGTGFNYGIESNHPYVKTLLEYKNKKINDFKHSSLFKYWNNFQPKSLAEYFRLEHINCHSLLRNIPAMHGIFPWSGILKLEYINNKKYFDKDYKYYQNGYCLTRTAGPHSIEFGNERFNNLVKIFNIINHYGFWHNAPRNIKLSDQYMIGNILIKNGVSKIMVIHGQHRSAALSALNYKITSILLGVNRGRGKYIIRYEDIDDWPLVKCGLFKYDEAKSVFNTIYYNKSPNYDINQ